MKRIWIGIPETNTAAPSLHTVLLAVEQQLLCDKIRVSVERSQGYGLTINRWDCLLDEADSIPVSIHDMRRLCAGEEEWFYCLDATLYCGERCLRFGLHDSSAIFVEGDDGDVENLCKRFSDCLLVV